MYNSVLKFLKGDFFHQFLLGAGRGGRISRDTCDGNSLP